MDSITTPVRHISLIDSLADGWLKLPFAVMRDVGPATQTLGGLLKHTNKETFVTAKDIAGKARRPLVPPSLKLPSLDAPAARQGMSSSSSKREHPTGLNRSGVSWTLITSTELRQRHEF